MDLAERILRLVHEPASSQPEVPVEHGEPTCETPAPLQQGASRRHSGRSQRGTLDRPLLLALLILLLPAPAEAQFRLPWRRHKPPALEQPQWPATPVPAASPPQVESAAAQLPAVTPHAAAQPPAVQPQALTPLQQEDRARLLKMARDASLTPAATVRDAEERMERWKMVMLVDPAHVEARLGYEQAQKALDAARAREETVRTTREVRDREQSEKRDRLRLAERALYTRDLDGAGSILADILRQHPDDPRAGSLMEMLRGARRAHEVRRRLAYGAAGLMVTALLLAAWARGAYRARREGAAPSTRPRALVRIVDGVGRGKLVPITQDILRIGAADDPEDGGANDLVVSDAGAAVSRYHCAIVRKGRDYLLLDSSLNGTRLNGRRLPHGEHHVLRHGDEFVLAGSSRLKFLRT